MAVLVSNLRQSYNFSAKLFLLIARIEGIKPLLGSSSGSSCLESYAEITKETVLRAFHEHTGLEGEISIEEDKRECF